MVIGEGKEAGANVPERLMPSLMENAVACPKRVRRAKAANRKARGRILKTHCCCWWWWWSSPCGLCPWRRLRGAAGGGALCWSVVRDFWCEFLKCLDVGAREESEHIAPYRSLLARALATDGLYMLCL